MRKVILFALFVSLNAGLVGAAGASSQQVDVIEPRESDAEVFLDVDATRGQIAQVRDAIRADADVQRFASVDHDAALAEFRRIFRRNREIRRGIRARDLPVSFRLVVRSGRLDSVVTRYEAMPGVESVEDRTVTPSDTWALREACSRTMYDLEVVMRDDATQNQIALATKKTKAYPFVKKVEVADTREVRAIFKCLRDRGARPLPSPLPPAILHIDVVDPAEPAVRALIAALVPTPGVDQVLRDQPVGPVR